MSSQPRIALVGDYNSSVPAHQAIPVALDLASAHLGVRVIADWLSTKKINCAADLASYQGIGVFRPVRTKTRKAHWTRSNWRVSNKSLS